MRFKKVFLMLAGCSLILAAAVIPGCSDKPVESSADTSGLKAVVLGAGELFQGDITNVPGYEYHSQQPGVTAKTAATDALIEFDAAYAMVLFCLGSNHIIDYPSQCENNTDLFNAFGGFTNRNKWENIEAGSRALELTEVVSVTELEKKGDNVEGTIYVKPGWNDVVIVYVRGDSAFYTSYNTYLNLDGYECEDCDKYDYESGWTYENWMSSHLYMWEFPVLGDLDITESSLNDLCTNDPPVIYLSTPADSAMNVSALAAPFYAYANDPEYDQLTYTLYCDESTAPTTVLDNGSFNNCNYSAILNPNTRYYWRVLFNDGENAVYSATRTFFTQLAFTPGTLTDIRDGKTYATVTIAGQEWMAENLNYGTLISGMDQADNATAEKYAYDDVAGNADTYGGLYQWGEAMQYSLVEGAQGICPAGWHLPTDAEWQTLERNVGMFQNAAADTGWRGQNQGTELKLGGLSGFQILLAGYRYSTGAFYDLMGTNASFWTSSQYDDDTYAWHREMDLGFTGVNRYYYRKESGFCVRCLRD